MGGTFSYQDDTRFALLWGGLALLNPHEVEGRPLQGDGPLLSAVYLEHAVGVTAQAYLQIVIAFRRQSHVVEPEEERVHDPMIELAYDTAGQSGLTSPARAADAIRPDEGHVLRTDATE